MDLSANLVHTDESNLVNSPTKSYLENLLDSLNATGSGITETLKIVEDVCVLAAEISSSACIDSNTAAKLKLKHLEIIKSRNDLFNSKDKIKHSIDNLQGQGRDSLIPDKLSKISNAALEILKTFLSILDQTDEISEGLAKLKVANPNQIDSILETTTKILEDMGKLRQKGGEFKSLVRDLTAIVNAKEQSKAVDTKVVTKQPKSSTKTENKSKKEKDDSDGDCCCCCCCCDSDSSD